MCKINWPAWEMRLIFAIWRMSWGWNRPGVYTSYRELSEKTRLDLRSVGRTLKRLIEKQILLTRHGRKRTWIEFNLDYETWDVPEKESLFSVGSTANGDVNKVLAPEPTPGVGSTANSESPENGYSSGLTAVGKQFLKEISFKETERTS